MLDALAEYAQRHGLVLAPGFARKTAAWAIWLDAQGRFVDLLDLRGDNRTGRYFDCCPELQQPELIAGGQRRSHFLLDTTLVVALYGYEDLEPREQQNILAKHRYFIGLLRRAASTDPTLEGCAAALDTPAVLDQVRERLATAKAKPVDRMTFRVEKDFVVDRDAWHAWWQEFRSTLNTKGVGNVSRCLQTGQLVEPARVHPKIKGLAAVGGQPSGAVLIGFDKAAFTSYGLEQAANAPVSEAAANVYVSALNDLIRRAGPPLAGSVLVHWYRDTVQDAEDPVEWLQGVFGTDTARDETDALRRARELLESVRSGERADLGQNRFHAALLSASGGRVMVRAWLDDTWDRVAANVARWFDDLAICTPTNGPPSSYGLRTLLRSLVRDDPTELPPALVAALWRAALLGERLPSGILASALQRLRADPTDIGRSSSAARMSLLKAVLVREARIEQRDSKVAIQLNETHPSPAYQAGRLLAVLAGVQRAALGDVGAGVVQRYYAAACATPGLVLGTLVRQSQYHLAKLDRGLAFWYENQMASVLQQVGGELPRTTTLEEQSLFALGYYQQLATLRRKATVAADEKEEA